jgi:hypothetical protein
MDLRTRLQLAEAFGPHNRWFCSKCCGCDVSDLEMLLRYYIISGGAANFAFRYAEAMGPQNRWYCSEFYRQNIQDPETLWQYYMDFSPAARLEGNPRVERRDPPDFSRAS